MKVVITDDMGGVEKHECIAFVGSFMSKEEDGKIAVSNSIVGCNPGIDLKMASAMYFALGGTLTNAFFDSETLFQATEPSYE